MYIHSITLEQGRDQLIESFDLELIDDLEDMDDFDRLDQDLEERVLAAIQAGLVK